MPLDPGLTFERLRHDIDTEMRLTSLAVAGMALVQVGFVVNFEALRL